MRTVIAYLAETDPNESPIISCFANVGDGIHGALAEIDAPANQITKQMTGDRRVQYSDALQRVRETLPGPLKPTTKSVAVFARGGDEPMHFPVEFEVEMPTRFIVDDLPHIYPPVELKDTYHRSVIVITTDEEVRILETSVGAVSEQIFASRPELQKRIVNVVASNPRNGIAPILLESIAQFVDAEAAESHDRVAKLESAVFGSGLGVAGIEASTNALNGGYADMLVIDQDFNIPEIRESLVRLATRKNVPIEMVSCI